jgi:hypothetical protein
MGNMTISKMDFEKIHPMNTTVDLWKKGRTLQKVIVRRHA